MCSRPKSLLSDSLGFIIRARILKSNKKGSGHGNKGVPRVECSKPSGVYHRVSPTRSHDRSKVAETLAILTPGSDAELRFALAWLVANRMQDTSHVSGQRSWCNLPLR